MNPFESRSAEKRRLILDAARAAFAVHGFHAASMAQIAARANMSVGHIYRYFDNKEAVIVAIVEADLEEAALEIAALEGDAQSVAAAMVERVESRIDPCGHALTLEILAEAARNPRVAERVREADVRLRAHLRDAVRKRVPAGDADLDSRVEVMCALFEGLMVRAIKTADGDRAAISRRVRTMLAQAMGG